MSFLPPDPKGEFTFKVPIYLLNLLVAVNRVRDAALEKALKPTGLTVTRYRTLAVIWRLRTCTMSELAVMSATDRTSLTRTVDQLVAAGQVDRTTPKGDRRKVELTITAAGLDVLRSAAAIADASNDECLADVSDDMQRTMVRGLELMLARIGMTAEHMEKVLNPRREPRADDPEDG